MFDILDKLIDALFGELVSEGLNGLKNNEIRLRILKKLGLKPDSPTDNFDSIYLYTLLDYGLQLREDDKDKKKLTLQLFKEEKIKKEFKQAFIENKVFDLQINNYIENSDLGRKIKNHNFNINYDQQLRNFTNLFIDTTKQARTPTSNLIDHELKDIKEILERGLPHGEIPRETELAKQLKKWFETLGYKFENYEVLEKEYFEWIINIPHPLGGYYRILIHGVEAEAGINDINAVKTIVETQKVDQGWIVAPRRVSKAARETVEKSEKKTDFLLYL